MAAKGKAKEAVKRTSPKVNKYYKIEGETLVRLRPSCPKCGPGVFMAEHKDRNHCGSCGHLVKKN